VGQQIVQLEAQVEHAARGTTPAAAAAVAAAAVDTAVWEEAAGGGRGQAGALARALATHLKEAKEGSGATTLTTWLQGNRPSFALADMVKVGRGTMPVDDADVLVLTR
jgi:hypothetical protein